MDYDTLIDPETWAFINRTLERHPADAANLDPQGQRAAYNKLCASFRHHRPKGIGSEDLMAESVPVRVYEAGHPTRTIMYFHGGGFVVGNLDTHDDVCAELCAQTGYRVVSVDYRLSPEHPHPAAFQDSWNATRWALDTYGDAVILVGDSAGGTLAASVAHYARAKTDKILAQVLIYPALGGTPDHGSYIEHAHAPMLTTNDMIYYMGVRHEGTPPDHDPTSDPLRDSDFSGLPPTVLFTADCDPLRDDAREYRDRILEAGGQAHWVNEEGLVHGYLRARHSVARAQDSFERISIAIEAVGQGIWTYD
ncbi:MAG: alpha/beta hydrolase [Paracoccaceae bacterium]